MYKPELPNTKNDQETLDDGQRENLPQFFNYWDKKN